LGTSEIQAAAGGGKIGKPPFIRPNGGMACDDSLTKVDPCPGPFGSPAWVACATATMFTIPSQTTPIITDMHASPCVVGGDNVCTYAYATDVARDIYSGVRSFIEWRGLTGNTVMFGESWANSPAPPPTFTCDDLHLTNGTETLTQQTVDGYRNSTLISPYAPQVVFRAWGNANSNECETPSRIGAPYGPYKR
jgi:hypothetical protein